MKFKGEEYVQDSENDLAIVLCHALSPLQKTSYISTEESLGGKTKEPMVFHFRKNNY